MKPVLVDVTTLLEESGFEQIFSGEVELEPARIGPDKIEFAGPLRTETTLTNAAGNVAIKGRILGAITLRCSRCLENYDLPMAVNIDEVAIVDDGTKQKDDVFVIENGKVNVSDIVYQNIMVEVPIKPLCRPDCAGLCPVCGKNLNEEPHDHEKEELDPRLKELKKFFDNR